MKLLNKTTEYLFYLFVFLLPWQTRLIWHQGYLNSGKWEYGTFSLYGTEILLFLIIFLGLIIFFLKKKEKKLEKQTVNLSRIYLLVVFLILASFVSIFSAINGEISRYAFIRLLEGTALFWLVLNLDLKFFYIGLAIILGALIQAGLAIFEFLEQSILSSKWLGVAGQLPSEGGVSVIETTIGRWLRAYGSLPHPNILGGFLAISLIILLILSFVSQKKEIRIFFYCLWPIQVVGLFLTFSREAWFGFFGALVFFAWVIFRSRAKEARIIFLDFLIVAVVITGLFIIFFKDPFMTRFAGANRLEVKSTERRLELYQESIGLLGQRWYLGVGIGNYTLAVHNLIKPDLQVWNYEPVHNSYLLIISELGILGLAVLFMIIYQIAKGVSYFRFNAERQIIISSLNLRISELVSFDKRFDYYFLGLTSCLIAIGIIALFDHFFWTLYFGIMLFWLVFGLWVKNLKGEKYSYI